MQSKSPRRSGGFFHRATALLGIGASFLLAAQALSSCSSSSTACTPGESQACTGGGADRCAGFQVCNDEGTGFSMCDCGGGSAGSMMTGSVGGSGGNMSMAGSGAGGGPSDLPFFTTQVGRPCTSDVDCPNDGTRSLVCLPADENGPFGDENTPGGPQGGYCTYPCNTEADICGTEIDANALCGLADDGGDGYCLALCQPGFSSTQQLLKCGADRAQACVPLTATGEVGLCVPICESDQDCGETRFCDPSGGLCVEEQPTGGDIGAPCTVETEVEDCASGLCLEFQDANENPIGSFCTTNCTLGGLGGCGYPRGGTEQQEAACLFPRTDNPDVGDIGICLELCDVDADCDQADAGWACEALPGDFSAEFGRAGRCIPSPLLPSDPGDAGAPADAAVVEDAG